MNTHKETELDLENLSSQFSGSLNLGNIFSSSSTPTSRPIDSSTYYGNFMGLGVSESHSGPPSMSHGDHHGLTQSSSLLNLTSMDHSQPLDSGLLPRSVSTSALNNNFSLSSFNLNGLSLFDTSSKSNFNLESLSQHNSSNNLNRQGDDKDFFFPSNGLTSFDSSQNLMGGGSMPSSLLPSPMALSQKSSTTSTPLGGPMAPLSFGSQHALPQLLPSTSSNWSWMDETQQSDSIWNTNWNPDAPLPVPVPTDSQSESNILDSFSMMSINAKEFRMDAPEFHPEEPVLTSNLSPDCPTFIPTEPFGDDPSLYYADQASYIPQDVPEAELGVLDVDNDLEYEEFLHFQELVASVEGILVTVYEVAVEFSSQAILSALEMAKNDPEHAAYIIIHSYNKLNSCKPCRHLLSTGCFRKDCIYDHSFNEIPCRYWLHSSCNNTSSGNSKQCPFFHGLVPIEDFGHEFNLLDINALHAEEPQEYESQEVYTDYEGAQWGYEYTDMVPQAYPTGDLSNEEHFPALHSTLNSKSAPFIPNPKALSFSPSALTTNSTISSTSPAISTDFSAAPLPPTLSASSAAAASAAAATAANAANPNYLAALKTPALNVNSASFTPSPIKAANAAKQLGAPEFHPTTGFQSAPVRSKESFQPNGFRNKHPASDRENTNAFLLSLYSSHYIEPNQLNIVPPAERAKLSAILRSDYNNVREDTKKFIAARNRLIEESRQLDTDANYRFEMQKNLKQIDVIQRRIKECLLDSGKILFRQNNMPSVLVSGFVNLAGLAYSEVKEILPEVLMFYLEAEMVKTLNINFSNPGALTVPPRVQEVINLAKTVCADMFQLSVKEIKDNRGNSSGIFVSLS